MSHPSFKTQLFRFVDVFPATTDDEDVLRHLREYFDGGRRAAARRSRRRRGRPPARRGPHLGVGRAPQHPPHGAAVHRRVDPGGGGRQPAQAVADGDGVHRRPPRREDGHRSRSRPLRGTRRGAAERADRRHRRLGAGRPPRPRRPRPIAAGERRASSRPRWRRTTARSPPTTASSRRRHDCVRSSSRQPTAARSCTSTWSTTTSRT